MQIDVAVSFAASASTVSGDRVRLLQVFWNVLKNGVKFTPTRGRIELRSGNLADSGAIEVRTTDSGIGMTQDELARAFEPFAQGGRTPREGNALASGLGLGLAISRKLIESHGGTIRAESAGPGHGTTIVITMPTLARAEPAAPASSSSSPGASLPSDPATATKASPRVLLVEDHQTTRLTLIRLLERRGCRVVAAETLASARRLLQTGSFDLLMCDLGLPDGDGCALMAEIRQSHPGLPGIAMSGYGMETDFERSRAAGFGEHLVKPVVVSAVEQAIRRALGRVQQG
ncbi:MAG TPA: hybrid sensor histidine kinase/response regulator [Candidatus Synoicihabitans sp.]|nr:hybrid sensor histidine kinase/response regulator [Candidatus Synoicihabitans sp.]